MVGLELLADPLVVILLAIGVFLVRVVFLAKRLKAASKHVTFADLRALEEAKRSLNAHKESLEAAKGTIQKNLGGARDTLRSYDAPFTKSIEDRREGIKAAMDGLVESRAGYKDEFRKGKDEFRKGIKDAKAFYKQAMPRKTHRGSSPKDI